MLCIHGPGQGNAATQRVSSAMIVCLQHLQTHLYADRVRMGFTPWRTASALSIDLRVNQSAIGELVRSASRSALRRDLPNCSLADLQVRFLVRSAHAVPDHAFVGAPATALGLPCTQVFCALPPPERASIATALHFRHFHAIRRVATSVERLRAFGVMLHWDSLRESISIGTLRADDCRLATRTSPENVFG